MPTPIQVTPDAVSPAAFACIDSPLKSSMRSRLSQVVFFLACLAFAFVLPVEALAEEEDTCVARAVASFQRPEITGAFIEFNYGNHNWYSNNWIPQIDRGNYDIYLTSRLSLLLKIPGGVRSERDIKFKFEGAGIEKPYYYDLKHEKHSFKYDEDSEQYVFSIIEEAFDSDEVNLSKPGELRVTLELLSPVVSFDMDDACDACCELEYDNCRASEECDEDVAYERKNECRESCLSHDWDKETLEPETTSPEFIIPVSNTPCLIAEEQSDGTLVNVERAMERDPEVCYTIVKTYGNSCLGESEYRLERIEDRSKKASARPFSGIFRPEKSDDYTTAGEGGCAELGCPGCSAVDSGALLGLCSIVLIPVFLRRRRRASPKVVLAPSPKREKRAS